MGNFITDNIISEGSISGVTISGNTFYGNGLGLTNVSATFNGGTVTGSTNFTGGISANTISATTITGTTINGTTITGTTINGTTITSKSVSATTITGTTSLTLNGEDSSILMTTITNQPTNASSGNGKIFLSNVGGLVSIETIGPSGLSKGYNSAMWDKSMYWWSSSSATAGLWYNTIGAGAGTYTQIITPTTTNTYTTMRRGRYANVVATSNQILGQRNTELLFFRGAATKQGGFFFHTRCGFDVWTNGGRFFAGMATATTVISANPSLLNNTVGFSVDSTDNGLIHFLTRDTVGSTKQSTGFTIVSNKGYDIYMYCAPNDTVVYYKIIDINTGTEYSNSATLTLPVNTVTLTANVLSSNAALNPATSIHLGINRIYLETEY